MPDLIPEALYTRPTIYQLLGGDLQSYLPHVNKRVVCGCFDISANPNAPEEVLVGEGENVVKYAKVLAQQTEPIPVFLKQSANEWKYIGNYSVVSYSENLEEVAAKASAAGRSDVVGVLYLMLIAR
jgi:hypothetical protein